MSAAVALEVLRLYEDGLLDNGRKAGARLMAGLKVSADHPLVGEVRGRGMLAAIELVIDKAQQDAASASAVPARRIFDRAWDNGLVIRAFANGVLGYAPPLCCTDAEIDAIVERTRMTLDETLGGSGRPGRHGLIWVASHVIPPSGQYRIFCCRAPRFQRTPAAPD